jgi:hypothetical protein
MFLSTSYNDSNKFWMARKACQGAKRSLKDSSANCIDSALLPSTVFDEPCCLENLLNF